MFKSSSKQSPWRNLRSLSFLFLRGALAGGAALLLNFFLRLGGVAPFPPESAIEAFLKIIPESIQEPAVPKYGELAGQLGLVAATIIAIFLYGILGIVFEKSYLPVISRARSLSILERFLSFSLVPWVLFGLVLLPIFGVSFFDVVSVGAAPSAIWLFPLSLLIVQLVFFAFVFYQVSNRSQITVKHPVDGKKKGEVTQKVPAVPLPQSRDALSLRRGYWASVFWRLRLLALTSY